MALSKVLETKLDLGPDLKADRIEDKVSTADQSHSPFPKDRNVFGAWSRKAVPFQQTPTARCRLGTLYIFGRGIQQFGLSRNRWEQLRGFVLFEHVVGQEIAIWGGWQGHQA